MSLSIEKQQNNNLYNSSRLSFKGPMDNAITQTLIAIDTNPMVNSAFVDVAAMVTPRTIIDTKKRNKYAGFETFFREFTGTIIMCFLAGPVAYAVGSIYSKLKKTGINPKIWATDSTFDTLKSSWEKSNKNVSKYVENVLNNMSGQHGNKVSSWKNINWKEVEWHDNPAWDKINWKDSKWKSIKDHTRNQKQIVKVLTDLIQDKDADSKDVKKVFDIVEHRIANALKVSKTVNVSIDDKNLSATLRNVIRDTHDLGKHIFNSGMDISKAEAALKATNKIKTRGAIAIVAAIGLGNQYLNRYISKKRTGKDDFVGYQDYADNTQKKESDKTNKSRLIALKALASAGIIALSCGVMKIRKPSDLIKRLEFTGPVTSGNAIKTLYTVTLAGRFLAARDENELRESTIRDYLGFLNWLVLGDFVSKGVAQLFFDSKQKVMFNIPIDGSKGAKKWLNSSLKSHAEMASMGKEIASKYIWKRNVAQVAGLLYSGLALGCALPLINIIMTKKQTEKAEKTEKYNLFEIYNKTQNSSKNV